MWLHGCLSSALAEFMGTWRWQNILPIEFLEMEPDNAADHVLLSNIYAAAGISVRMLNGRERKKV
jgi:hypothetical protein